jgi:hypothetical protein
MVLIGVVDLVTGKRTEAENALERYSRTFVCMQCGEYNLLPQGWDGNDQAATWRSLNRERSWLPRACD